MTDPLKPAPSGEDVNAEMLRAEGWMVAVHNDYRLNGELHTFWLFTHPDGRWIKGEGRTDSDALRAAIAAAERLPAPGGGEGDLSARSLPDRVEIDTPTPRSDGEGE